MNKFLNYVSVIVLGICVLSFFPFNAFDLRMSKQILSEIALIALVSLFFVKNVWLKIFMVWILARHLFGLFEMNFFPMEDFLIRGKLIKLNAPDIASHNFSLYYKYSSQTINIVFHYLLGYQVFREISKRKTINFFLNAICVITLIQCAWMFIQNHALWVIIVPKFQDKLIVMSQYVGGWVTLSPLWSVSVKDNMVTGLMSNANMTGSVLALGMPAFFRGKWTFGIPFVLLALFLSHSMGGMVPALIALIAFAFIKLKKYRERGARYMLVAGTAMIGFCYTIFNFSKLFAGRIDTWAHAIEIGSFRGLIGWGSGQFKCIFPIVRRIAFEVTRNNINRQLHNEWGQLFFELGTIGCIIVIGFFVSLFWRALNTRQTRAMSICVIGVMVGCINAGVNFLFHTTACILMLAYIALLERGVEDGTY